MAAKRRFLDLWIIESNTVYKEVPYEVACDWVQQGRLLEEDRYKPSGTSDWFAIGKSEGLSAFLPRAEPTRPEDQASALEPVELEFTWHKRHEEDDEEVDMIPLIDVSLVLLIFFMLTGKPQTSNASAIKTPEAGYAPVADTTGIWIGIDLQGTGDNQVEVYSFGEDAKPAEKENSVIRDMNDLVSRVNAVLAKKTEAVNITIHADKDIKSKKIILPLTAKLNELPNASKIRHKYDGVKGKAS